MTAPLPSAPLRWGFLGAGAVARAFAADVKRQPEAAAPHSLVSHDPYSRELRLAPTRTLGL